MQERREVMTNEYDNIIKRLFDEYELTRSEAEQLNIKLDDPLIAKKELAEIKSKMKALGNVNVGAIEEYREVSERYEFYKVQIDDVEKTRTELYKLINNLTGTMRDMFTDGFGKINRNFQKTFTDLFRRRQCGADFYPTPKTCLKAVLIFPCAYREKPFPK